ncbi:MAG: DUF4838 domain-containing protein [Lachnospiraceae bacterium]|nr:DUF4838 domain-containing protein [Lachnospiraceae bacterium]
MDKQGTMTYGSQETLAFAQQELERCLSLLPLAAGTALPAVRLMTDETLVPEGNPEDDVFRYAADGDEIRVRGGTPRAVLLGVYAYLRRIGFVFYRPDTGESEGTQIPALTEANALHCPETTVRARFRHRCVCIEGSESEENMLRYIDWLPKAGYNACFIQFLRPDVFLKRYYCAEQNPFRTPEMPTEEDFLRIDEELTKQLALRGLTEHRVGHGWTSRALGYDGSGWYAAKEEPAEEIRPLIAELKGVRALRDGVPANTSLCYANPAAGERLIEEVVRYAQAHPYTRYLHFWLADEHDNICECEACRKTTPADQYVDILNRMAERMDAEGLETKIVFLIYHELLYAPLKARFQNTERFVMMFAPISRSFESSYPEEPGGVTLPPFVRNQLTLPKTPAENLKYLQLWQEVFDGEVFDYDYHLGRAHYGEFGYVKIAKILFDDLRMLKRYGMNGYISCQELRVFLPNSFPVYVMGLALLEEDRSFEELKTQYFAAAYGDRAKEAAAYFERMSAHSDTDYFNAKGARTQPEKAEHFAAIAGIAEEMLPVFAQWEMESPAHIRRNMELLTYHATYSIPFAKALEHLCRGEETEASKYFAAFRDIICKNEDAYQPYLDVYRVLKVSQQFTGLRPEDGESP